MDIAWLILDSVSWDATPFSEDGPRTMPQLERLAEQYATVFTNCYTAGTASPDSHSAFFTGRYPSQAGYHRGYYQYDGAYPTVADVTAGTHESVLITQNQYVLGLGESFDTVVDVGASTDHSAPFPEATDPDEENDLQQYEPLRRYIEFVKRGGKPIRSIVNGISYKYNDIFTEDSYVDVATADINAEIREHSNGDDPRLVVANYMGAHPPFAPTDEAMGNFAKEDRIESLPVGEEVPYRHSLESSEYNVSDVRPLYHASIWDLDRDVAPLVRELLERETVVFVLADHGTCVNYVDPLSDIRTHVPLLIFTPDEGHARVPHTVNLRHIAATTTSLLSKQYPEVRKLPGRNLLAAIEDEVSITEYIHYGRKGDPPASNTAIAHATEELVYRVAARTGDARVDYFDHDDSHEVIRGDETTTEELRRAIDEHRREVLNSKRPEGDGSYYFDVDEDHLRHLGYLE